MSSCYVSPIPARIVMRYSRSKRREIPKRTHFYPNARGGEDACTTSPKSCRECWREQQCEESHD